ncbi:helix-turn-helix transcriptional regulator [Variovorax sp. CYS-02]|uniref:Helix-turn-helix transcriptional regulator n=2 Tax=Variovorax terrae TaxID=2923278 RepID=A0A9X2ALG1_9BURK|nr:helix-turn-helix transcriptional regulator [Variovorax terrae]MCJ0762274.1 helix-turn-helix transcriptional regulator [Variovorax terrae]
MSNVAAALKEEIARVARKEVRSETQKLKKASVQHRTDIAALKRRVQALEQQVARLRKAAEKRTAAATTEQPASVIRFSAKGLATQRQRLGLSAAEMGALLGVSGQSVYKWEDGKTRPRASQMPAIASLRGLGKRAAAARLSELAG